MRILPLLYCPSLTEDDIYRHECSDRIWVPQHTFERWLLAEDVGHVTMVSLEGIPACMYAPHTGARNVVYAPTWMCEELRVSLDPTEEEDDYIVPERIQPPTCTFVRVQPHTSDHIPTSCDDPMPEETLSRGFEEYTCLREGQTLALHLPSGTHMFVTIVEAEPKGGPVYIRSQEIQMDMLEALDTPGQASAPEEASQSLSLPFSSDTPTVPTPPTPPTHPPESREERRQRLANAAMARLQKSA